MPDILIRNIPASTLSLLDSRAARLGISRSEYLRRQIEHDVLRERGGVTVADLARAAGLASDLLNDEVIQAAWS